MPEPHAEQRVQAALKTTIESNLARERAIEGAVDRLPGVGFFSNGIIFSKSGNGTPFSNGIFFSKTGRVQVELGDPELGQLVQDLAAFDEAAFSAFTDRLLRLRQVKGQGGGASAAAH
jgi:hypothetical protein